MEAGLLGEYHLVPHGLVLWVGPIYGRIVAPGGPMEARVNIYTGRFLLFIG